MRGKAIFMIRDNQIKWAKVVFILLFSSILLSCSLLIKPLITGDGREYLGMTVSFKNHMSFDLTLNDIDERLKLEKLNSIHFPEELTYAGYFEDIDGKFYSYHFWFYSLLNVVPYIILEQFDINPLKSFQLTNCLLYIFLMYKIMFRNNLNNKTKSILLCISLFCPIIFYLNWTHTEVFSYVFLFIGLLNLYENKLKQSMLHTSISALQNPAISIIPLYILFSELIKGRKTLFQDKKKLSSFFLLGVISLLNIIPYLFYWMHYRKFSLISSTGYASLDFITFDKIWSLFFDLNFGLIVYVPLLLLVFSYQIYKKGTFSFIAIGILLFISIVSSTQLNWNSGMMYINRYSVWMIPLLIFGTIEFYGKLSFKKAILFVMIYTLTTGIVSAVCLKEHDYSNYLKFGPVAKFAISNFPNLYNPEFEIFYERALGYERLNKEEFPIEISNNNGLRKMLVLDESSEMMGYVNGGIQLNNNNNLFRVQDGKNDILHSPYKFGLGNGWHSLEKSVENKYRWMGAESSTLLIANETKEHKLLIETSSYYTSRQCAIYLNDNKIYEGTIPSGQTETINIPIVIKQGSNTLRIVSLDGADKPSIVDGSADARGLSFVINSIIIE